MTFCPACGSETPQSKPRCEMCNAPLKEQRVDWGRRLRSIPTPSPVVLLATLAVIALVVAIVTGILLR